MTQQLTKEQAAIIGAYTGVCAGPFGDVHEYVEKIMGRPVWTHEFPSIADEIKERSRADFIAICRPKDAPND